MTPAYNDTIFNHANTRHGALLGQPPTHTCIYCQFALAQKSIYIRLDAATSTCCVTLVAGTCDMTFVTHAWKS